MSRVTFKLDNFAKVVVFYFFKVQVRSTKIDI